MSKKIETRIITIDNTEQRGAPIPPAASRPMNEGAPIPPAAAKPTTQAQPSRGQGTGGQGSAKSAGIGGSK